MLNRLARQLLPGVCLLCECPLAADVSVDLCMWCRQALPWNHTACPGCAEPLASAGWCPRCRETPPPFSFALAPLRYERYTRAWIGRLKNHLGMVEGRLLGMLLAEAAASAYGAGPDPPRCPDLVVPVPLSPWRLARRGHNQAVTLARPVARQLGIPLLRRAVFRRSQGRRQRGLSRADRLGNLQGTFAARRSWSTSPCIAVVDDVLTTGATAAAVSRVLLEAGAGEVHVLCATRTPRS